jgi:U3 small nucleolar RNA-associated protein 18
MPNKERGHSKRLKISTGDDKASGATGSHIRKSRKAAARAAALPKTEEEKRLEEQIFGLDCSNQDAFAAEGDDAVDDLDAVPYAMDWLGQKREEKLKSRRGRADSGGEDELGALGDDQVRSSHCSYDPHPWADAAGWVLQLFFTDAPGPSTLLLKFGTPSGDDDEDDDDDGEESSEDASSDDDDEEDRDDAQKARLKQASAARKPLWHDPADASLTVSLAGHTRLRKLRQTAEEDVVSGREYEARLRQQ